MGLSKRLSALMREHSAAGDQDPAAVHAPAYNPAVRGH
jgi:hypothetical protein